MNDDLSADDIEAQKKYHSELLTNVVKNCLLNIRDIPTLIRLATVRAQLAFLHRRRAQSANTHDVDVRA
jgi:hypothetical protein